MTSEGNFPKLFFEYAIPLKHHIPVVRKLGEGGGVSVKKETRNVRTVDGKIP